MSSVSTRSLKGLGRHRATAPRYGKFPPNYPNRVVSQPPIGMPPYLVGDPSQASVIEPTFGYRITRISDKATFDHLSGNLTTVYYRHLYPPVQPWNADQSRIALQTPDANQDTCIWILDGRTYRALYCITNCGQGHSFRWSNTDPDKAYVKKAGSATISSIRPVSNPSSSPILADIHTFSEFTNTNLFLSFSQDKGDFSLDDRYFAAVGQRTGDNALGITVWDIVAAAQIGSTYWFRITASGTASNNLQSVSPLGTSVIVEGSQGTGISALCVVAGGTGYTQGASVTFTGGGGSGSVATINVTSGAITSFTITAAGTGYTSIPSVTLPGGTGATFCVGMQGTWWYSLTGFPGPGFQNAAGVAQQPGSAAFILADNGHSDIALDLGGNEVLVMVSVAQSGAPSTNLGIPGLPVSTLICPVSASGVGTKSMLESYSNDSNVQDHVTCRSRARNGWVYISDQSSASSTGGNGRPAWGRGTLYGLELTTGKTHPFCGLHTSYDADNNGLWVDGTSLYAGATFVDYQSNVCVSRDGTKVMFASDWGQEGQNSNGVSLVYSYVVDLVN